MPDPEGLSPAQWSALRRLSAGTAVTKGKGFHRTLNSLRSRNLIAKVFGAWRMTGAGAALLSQKAERPQ